MRKELTMLFLAAGATGLFTSCISEEQDLTTVVTPEAKGKVSINLQANSDFTLLTRGLSENNYKNTANYTVQIVNATTQAVVFTCKGSDLVNSFPKTLNIGSYRVDAFYGNEHAASRDEFRVEGSSVFTVKGDEEKAVSVNCTPTCGKLSVVFDSNMSKYFENYSVTYGGTKKLAGSTITWAKNDTEPWYIALDEAGETVEYTISLTTKEEFLHKVGDKEPQANGEVKGTIKLQRNRAHKLTVKPNYTPTTDGGMSLTISIDDSTNDHVITWEVPVTWI